MKLTKQQVSKNGNFSKEGKKLQYVAKLTEFIQNTMIIILFGLFHCEKIWQVSQFDGFTSNCYLITKVTMSEIINLENVLGNKRTRCESF